MGDGKWASQAGHANAAAGDSIDSDASDTIEDDGRGSFLLKPVESITIDYHLNFYSCLFAALFKYSIDAHNLCYVGFEHTTSATN
jgi:hypothetical protein